MTDAKLNIKKIKSFSELKKNTSIKKGFSEKIVIGKFPTKVDIYKNIENILYSIEKKPRINGVLFLDLNCYFSSTCKVDFQKEYNNFKKFIKTNFGTCVFVYSRIYKNEKNQIIQFILIPTFEEKLKAYKILGDKQNMKNIISSFYEIMENKPQESI